MHRIDSRQIKAVCNRSISEHELSKGLKKCARLAFYGKLAQIPM